MEVNATFAIDLEHDADVGAARRQFAALAAAAGLDEARTSDAALIASELATNVIKHAKHGGMLFDRVANGVAIVAWDRGPGMNVEACMRDGMSTAGTAGNGLGAITRLASHWDVYSRPGAGVVFSAHVFPRGHVPKRDEIAGVAVPYPGLPISGDAWSCHERGGYVTIMVSDGLGHGDDAAAASRAVIASFAAHAEETPAAILERANGAAKATRGVAATIVRIDREAHEAAIAGVGNVSAWIIHDSSRQLVTQHGTLGQVTPVLREERYPFPSGSTLVMCSDGLKSRIPFDERRDLLTRSPRIIAATLWRDFARGRDDATAVVFREAR